MSRGNRGGAVFEDDADREMFLETLGQACSKTGWIVYCYRRYMQQRVVEIAGSRKPHDLDPDWSKIRRGWCLGVSRLFGRSCLNILTMFDWARKRQA